MSKTVPIQINVINGVVQECAVKMYFKSNEIVPIGQTIIRYFDIWMNQYAHKTFYISQQQDLFGTNQFQSFDDFWNYILPPTDLLIGDCNLQLFGMDFILN